MSEPLSGVEDAEDEDATFSRETTTFESLGDAFCACGGDLGCDLLGLKLTGGERLIE